MRHSHNHEIKLDVQRVSVNQTYLAINMLAFCKAHLRIEHDRDDTLIESYIRRAIAKLERQSGIAIFESRYVFEFDHDHHSGLIHHRRSKRLLPIPIKPWRSLEIYDDAGNDITPQFKLHGDTTQLGYGESYIELNNSSNSIFSVTAIAGYDSPDELPPQLEGIILRLAGHYYENRESTLIGVSYSTYSDFEQDVLELWQARV